jgi:sugar/nucleoside kinase (ribokinase family)
MENPEILWTVLPHLNLFLCNLGEAEIISGCQGPDAAADFFHQKGAENVIVKLGADGCWLSTGDQQELIPSPVVNDIVDTTGAGDAFAAGLLAGLRQGKDLVSACKAGNHLGAKTVTFLGAVKL